jgi:hypothetical protein
MIRRVKKSLLTGLALAVAAGSLSAQVAVGLGGLPLYFEAGPARPDGTAQFIARSREGQVQLSADGAQIALRQLAPVQMQFVGASPTAQIHGDAELAGKINYLTGRQPAQWRTGISTFAKVRVENLYPGISTVYYGKEQQLEYDFNLSPGTFPGTIAFRFQGVDKLAVNDQGDLTLTVGSGVISQPKPVMYQLVGGARQAISGGYKILADNTVTFAVGNYDHQLPLVIDPILSYATYFGGTLGQTAYAVAVNTNDGSIFLAGQTVSKNFVTNGWAFSTSGAYQTNFQGGIYTGDAFVARFDTNYNLIYLTYLGGNGDDQANCLAVDASDHAFVGGFTGSSDFPVTNLTLHSPVGVPGVSNQIGGVYQHDTTMYPLDGFVAELSADGSSLVYSTFLGGSQEDAVEGLAIDGADNVYVTGYTFSTNLPAKNAVAFQLTGRTNQFLNYLACTNTYANCNAFVAKISNLGTNLDYLTYFGGCFFDVAYSIALDGNSNVYIAGYTSSTNFPNTNSAQKWLNLAVNGTNQSYAYDAFVTKFAQANSSMNVVYSTFIGSTNNDEAFHIAADDSGAYVTGWTTSTNFPNTTLGGSGTNTTYPVITTGITNIAYLGYIATTNAFLTKLTNNSAGQAGIAYSVVFGGRFSDIANGVAVDSQGNAFVTGQTTSTNFPTSNYLGTLRSTNSSRIVNQTYHPAGYNAFVIAFNASCSQVLYSVCLGGSANDYGNAIAVDSADTVYVVGSVQSTNFPTTTYSTNFPIATALYPYKNGTNDAFLAKIVITEFMPTLNMSVPNPSHITLSWRDYTEPEIGPYYLESNTNSDITANNWAKITNAVTVINGTNTVTVPALNPSEVFRLHQ